MQIHGQIWHSVTSLTLTDINIAFKKTQVHTTTLRKNFYSQPTIYRIEQIGNNIKAIYPDASLESRNNVRESNTLPTLRPRHPKREKKEQSSLKIELAARVRYTYIHSRHVKQYSETLLGAATPPEIRVCVCVYVRIYTRVEKKKKKTRIDSVRSHSATRRRTYEEAQR